MGWHRGWQPCPVGLIAAALIVGALFHRSGWTQEELAKKEGKARPYQPTPTNLTECRFRDFWERTEKDETNERIRFGQVQPQAALSTG